MTGKRGRGRGRGRPRADPATVSAELASSAGIPVVKTLSFPVTDKDDDEVECSLCNRKSTFRDFRIHNLTTHYNLATTSDDTVTKDYKFFTRQLTDMAKIMKISTFNCPNENCHSRYKSALGLGYHLEQCGKTSEEILSSYVTCEVCDKPYPPTSINQHRKSHQTKPIPAEKPAHESSSKRISAQRAQKMFKTMSTKRGETDDADESHDEEPEEKDKDEEFIISEIRPPSPEAAEDVRDEEVVIPPPSHEDITYHAYKSLANSTHFLNVWEKPVPFTDNIFRDLPLNPLKPLRDARSYLPDFQSSFTFRTRTRIPDAPSKGNLQVVHSFNTTDYHRLRIFDSEIADGNNIVNTGGPVSAISWHPSGKYLAVATLKNHADLPQVHNLEVNRTCIQIYENQRDTEAPDTSVGLAVKLLLGIENGFIHHMEWSNFCCETQSSEHSDPLDDFLGHLAYACGDSSLDIVFLRKSDLRLKANSTCSDDSPKLFPFYSKVPEIKLRVHDPIGNDTGQCVAFNWSEEFRYLAAGYGSGMIALFNLLHESKLLKKRYEDAESNQFTEIYPIWYIRAHTDTISSIFFHPTKPRYVVTTSYDYYIKTWDIELRSEVESKKIGMVLDACWIRGWITCAVSVEYINTIFQIGAFNNVRFYPVGNSKSFTGCADHFNITSISFFEGMVAQASEAGKVTISYFDQFLRECDYDRNKKKRNTVDFSTVSIDKDGESCASEEEAQDPRIVITFTKHRRESPVLIQDPTSEKAEEYNVYYNFIRINKLLWSPKGNQLTTGYHNGLLTITPASFHTLYPGYR